MKGAAPVIANLQAILAAEYNINLQYRNDSVALKFLGVPKLAQKFKKHANQSHEFYQQVTKRLLVIGGSTSVDVGKITEEADVPGLLKDALSAETNLCQLGITGIETAVAAKDETTAEKLRHIEERHEDRAAWIEQQLNLIKQMGVEIYLSEKL